MTNVSMVKMSSSGQIIIPSEMTEKFDKSDDLVLINQNEKIILEKANSLSEKQKDDLEFSRRIKEAWKDIDEGKFTEYSTEEYLKKLRHGS